MAVNARLDFIDKEIARFEAQIRELQGRGDALRGEVSGERAGVCVVRKGLSVCRLLGFRGRPRPSRAGSRWRFSVLGEVLAGWLLGEVFGPGCPLLAGYRARSSGTSAKTSAKLLQRIT